MIQPIFPLICIAEDGTLDLISTPTSLETASAISLIHSSYFEKQILFDANYGKWQYRQVAKDFKNTFFSRFFAKVFYNKMYPVEVVWTYHNTYSIDELKQQMNACIDKDDDLITQFEEGDVIKAAINKSLNFNDILQVLDKYVFSMREV
jgi:hypothetical protein